MHTTHHPQARSSYPLSTRHTPVPRMTKPALVLEKSRPLLSKKTEVLHYYRAQKLQFLNLGSVLIGISDHLLYHFNTAGEVDWVSEVPA